MPRKKNVLPKGASLSNLQNVEIPTAPPEIQERVDNLEPPEAIETPTPVTEKEISEPTTPTTDTSKTTGVQAESTAPQPSSVDEPQASEQGPDPTGKDSLPGTAEQGPDPTSEISDNSVESSDVGDVETLLSPSPEAPPTAIATEPDPEEPATSFAPGLRQEEPLRGIASETPCEDRFQKLLVHIRTRWTTANINAQVGMLQRAGGFGDLKDWPIPDRFGLPQQIMVRLRNEKYLRELWLQVVFTRHKEGSGSHLGNGIAEAKIVTALAIYDLLDEYCPRKRIDEAMSE